MDRQEVIVFAAIVLVGLWPAIQVGGWLADRVPRPVPSVSPTPSGSGVLRPAPARSVSTFVPYQRPTPRSTWRPESPWASPSASPRRDAPTRSAPPSLPVSPSPELSPSTVTASPDLVSPSP